MKKYFYELIDPWEISLNNDPEHWLNSDINIDTNEILNFIVEVKLPKGLTYKTKNIPCNIKLITAIFTKDTVTNYIESEIEITIGNYISSSNLKTEFETNDSKDSNSIRKHLARFLGKYRNK